MKKYLCIILLAVFPAILFAQEAPKVIKVTIEKNDYLDVEFVRKIKTQDRGYHVIVKFINKTDKDIHSLGITYFLYEGDWQIMYNGITTSGLPVLIKKKGTTEVDVTGVASSVDRIHFEIFDIK
ncbi:MAG: hypothetical protein PHR23_06730 [bacterium]|jgi:hypothetical protein|nr:hypothetical protein [bacterium]